MHGETLDSFERISLEPGIVATEEAGKEERVGLVLKLGAEVLPSRPTAVLIMKKRQAIALPATKT